MTDDIPKLEKLKLAIQLYGVFYGGTANSELLKSVHQMTTGAPDVGEAVKQIDHCLAIVYALIRK